MISLADGFQTSGTSPGTIHLFGPGRVGRAFLREIAGSGRRLVAASDASASVFSREGLDSSEIVRHKAAGRRLCELPGAQPIPADLAAGLVRADVVVDATPSDPGDAESSLSLCRAALRAGSRVALASKNALAIAAEELLGADPGRVGCNAALGGTGARLARELGFFRRSARRVALVANASTTAVLEAIEQGADLEEALLRCRQRGVLEPDPRFDLDGTDAAQKLAIVARAVFGLEARPGAIAREDLRSIDPQLVWWRAQRGRTTRLVARASRGGELRVACEELPRSSALAVPSDRVAYAYELEDGSTRVHVGVGIGPVPTAQALLADVRSAVGGRP